MTLTFSTPHLGYIANFLSDKHLFFKVKSAWIAAGSDPASIAISGLSVQDVIGVYSQISSMREGLAADINQEIKAALLPQLLNAETGQPKDEECAALLQWIQQFTAGNAQEKLMMIEAGLAELNR